jgi:hypothetical protein
MKREIHPFCVTKRAGKKYPPSSCPLSKVSRGTRGCQVTFIACLQAQSGESGVNAIELLAECHSLRAAMDRLRDEFVEHMVAHVSSGRRSCNPLTFADLKSIYGGM